MQLSVTTLTHAAGTLEPFEERHRDGLIAAAHADVGIFRHMPFPVARDGYGAWFDWLRAEQDAGRWAPFAVINTFPAGGEGVGAIVGQSCYINIRPELACVEIGGTWYRREAQGTAVNPAAKLLLLGHAFACGAERVEFKTDALNMHSRNAMLKLGLTFEGVMRHQARRPDGSWRDNAWFSAIREDWPALRDRIEARLARSD
ncbi:MAG: GNAT family N-acetyltransferase [Hyphomonadaceae bacterium]|nr:GNAT family N-acetyltransferase [Hyphomonadaceae bacterium]